MDNYLITGITGQDGLYLTSEILRNENSKIYGISRNNEESFYKNLQQISKNLAYENIEIVYLDLLNKLDVKNFVNDIKPKKIFNLSGPSSVYNSLKPGDNTGNTIKKIFDNLFDSITINENVNFFFQASSSEMFLPSSERLDEKGILKSRSPYAEAKIYCHEKVKKFNTSNNISCVSGIMFNHESRFRGAEYLVSKIINTALEIKKNKSKKLVLGSLDYTRDWSFAGDIAKAIYKLSHEHKKDSYIISSGKGRSIEDIVKFIFSYFDMDYLNYVEVDNSLLRPNDPKSIIGNPQLIYEDHNWKVEKNFEELLSELAAIKLHPKLI